MVVVALGVQVPVSCRAARAEAGEGRGARGRFHVIMPPAPGPFSLTKGKGDASGLQQPRKGSAVCKAGLEEDPGYVLENWFNTPPGQKLEDGIKGKICETVDTDGKDIGCRHEDMEGRVKFEDVDEGLVIEGTVREVALYHGCFIDIGAEWDGIVPITEVEWFDIRDQLKLGTKVKVRVERTLVKNRHRFPIELKLLEPDLGQYIAEKPDRVSPIFLYADDELEDVSAETGRPIPDNKMYAEFEWRGQREQELKAMQGEAAEDDA